MKEVRILHNPRCSKSRETLSLIESRGYQPITIDYLNGELTEQLLREILHALNMPAKKILRTNEEEFKALTLNIENDEEVIKAILAHPKIVERPIVIKDDKAVIGRPPENVLTIL